MDSFSLSYEALAGSLRRCESLQLVGLGDAQRQAILDRLIADWRKGKFPSESRLVFVHSDPKQLSLLENLLRSNSGDSLRFAESQAHIVWGFQRYLQQNHIRAGRLRTLSELTTRTRGEAPPLILASFAGLMQKTAAPLDFSAGMLALRRGEEYDLDTLLQDLEERGYRRCDQVDEPGQYAVKGGLLDVFSPAHAQPGRFEFFADTLEKIKLFSIDTQLSTAEVPELWISSFWEERFPRARRREDAQRLYEALLDQPIASADRQGLVDAFSAGHILSEMPIFLPALRRSSQCSTLDYLQKGDLLIFLEALEVCLERYENIFARWQNDYQEDRAGKRPVLSPEAHFLPPEKAWARVKDHGFILQFGMSLGVDSNPAPTLPFSAAPPPTWAFPRVQDKSALPLWMEYLQKLSENALQALVLVRQPEHFLRVRSVLQHHGLDFGSTDSPYFDFLEINGPRPAKALTLGLGSLPQVLWDEAKGLLLVPEHVLFGETFQPLTPKKSAKARSVFASFQDLSPHSLVVHADHGIGRYVGMKTMTVAGIETDFLILEYADQDRVYLPVHRLNLLQKYAAGDGDKESTLDKLKSQAWAKRKARAKKAIRDMADQLLKLYAQRRLSQRAPYSEPSDIYFQFEADFPYAETDDQQKAIDEVNTDLSSELPMDRMICGDVGFGKTEVALRAAMRVVLDGQQVIVLAPTTLLSYQHFESFRARFRPYGIEVGLANRFVKAEAIRNNLKNFTEGRLDIIIGTHRLLSKDVKPRNLGLLIVDEEQRFGVGHKETIKAFKAACDILTLTATPIPRSLHMSLLGIRDISVIATAPNERLSIKTYVAQYQDDLIKRAIEQEIKRGGQVFFVHNRVVDILEMAAKLRKILPDVTFAVAHGQMKENNVETVIIDFIQQKFSVLVCTTIIESGIDMPNVNTIIINNADRFGLAQLYQMRGRVGRSTRQSYAYFLTAGKLADREESRQRLEILATHQQLGAGFQIASYDMEMRGTGNLLGGEQSGHMEDIGYEMFLDLLEKEMAAVRGQEREPDIDPEIKIPISASLPELYIPQEKQRLALYKSLFSAQAAVDIDRLRRETTDRFGNLPKEAYNLFQVAFLKVLLRKMRVEQLQILKPGVFEIRMSQLKAEQIRTLTESVAKRPERTHLTADFRLLVYTKVQGGISKELEDLIEVLLPLTLD